MVPDGAAMKRSPLPRSTKPLRRGSRLRPMSAKRRAVNVERAKVVAQLRETRRGCEGMALLRQAAHNAPQRDQEAYVAALRSCDPWQRVLQPHEPLTRARRGSITDPANILMLCDGCHSWTHANPRLSTEAGMLLPSWRG